MKYYLSGGFALAILTLVAVQYLKNSPPQIAVIGGLPSKPSSPVVINSAPERAHVATSPALAPRNTITNTPRPYKGSYQSELKRLAQRLEFEVSPEELARAQATYDMVFEARQLIESRNARVKVIDEKHYLIEIPSYKEQGDQLQSVLQAGFVEAMGEEKSQRFLAQAKIKISDANNNWGAEDQLIDVFYHTEGGVYEITHGKSLASTPTIHAPVMVSGSRLKPSNLDKYSYLKSVFPNPTN